MKQAYLSYTGTETRSLGGVGIFAAHLPPLQVSESIAHQYETDEMKALGWVVVWKDEGGEKGKRAKSEKD